MVGKRKVILKPLLQSILVIILAGTVSLGVYDYRPVTLYIEATSEHKNMEEIYKETWARLSFQDMQNMMFIDTTDDRIVLVFFVYNDMVLDRCEQLLNTMVCNRDYKKIDYYFVY